MLGFEQMLFSEQTRWDCRVDRDQFRGELLGKLRGQPLVGGGDREELVLGVHQLAAAAEAGHRACEQGERALLQLLGVKADAVEERELQLAGAVGDDDLEPLLRAAAGRRLRALTRDVRPDHAGHGHPGEHGHVVALAERVQRGQLAPGVIATRIVAQQVTDRPQAEDLLERVARLLTQHLGQRIAQRGHVASIGARTDIPRTTAAAAQSSGSNGNHSVGGRPVCGRPATATTRL